MSDDLRAKIAELRSDILACLFQPGGGEDLGFQIDSAGWVRSRGGVTVVIEGPWRDSPDLFTRTRYRGGHRIGAPVYHPTARTAMRAKP